MILSNNFSSDITMDQVPGEHFLLSCLQKPIAFSINNKVIKRGRLLLFRRVHYFIQIVLNTEKNVRENFEIPIPFKVENYTDEGLLYFDYRITSLNLAEDFLFSKKVSSTYFNKILELSVVS
jgi:hypothetical protein